MKVVPDTMMWVSYSTHADGARARVIDRALQSRARLFTSEYILDEVERVLEDRQELPRSFVRRSLRLIRRGWLQSSIFRRPSGRTSPPIRGITRLSKPP